MSDVQHLNLRGPHRFIRRMRAQPRLYTAAGAAVLVGLLLPAGFATYAVTRWLIAWNVGAALYVLLAAVMMVRSSTHQMHRRAQLQDDGEIAILVVASLAAVASLVAIAFELSIVKEMHGYFKAAHMALAGVTVLSSWAFLQVMFAIHYGHQYYAAVCHGHSPVLEFPGGEEPDYGDFFYFSAVIGTSGQTADVSFRSKRLRRLGSLHCILAYMFNTTVLALLINIGASLV